MNSDKLAFMLLVILLGVFGLYSYRIETAPITYTCASAGRRGEYVLIPHGPWWALPVVQHFACANCECK